jgi:predicted MFS family arabinose efflux permease
VLYAVGGIPLVLFPWFRRQIPETRRYAELRGAGPAGPAESRVGALTWLLPLRDLVRESPRRALGIALGGLLPSFGIIATLQLTGYFTQTVRGYTAAQYAAMIVVAGGVGVLGNLLAGRAADHFGRRLTGAVLLAAFPLCALLFYRGTAWMLPPALALCIFTAQGGRSILRALSTELFPTSYRGAASGVFTILDVLGAAVGLFVLGRLVGGPGELALKVPWIAAITGLGSVVVLLLPETSQRELETLS